MPGVEAAALATPRLPFDVNFNQTAIRIDGKAYGPDDRGEIVANVAVSPDYFETLAVPDRRRSRLHRRRPRGGAARRRRQRDHGAPLLARRERRRTDLRDGLSATARSIQSSASRAITASHRQRAADAVSPLRRGAAPLALQLRRRAHARRCGAAARRHAPRAARDRARPGVRVEQRPWRTRWRAVAAAAAGRRRGWRWRLAASARCSPRSASTA